MPGMFDEKMEGRVFIIVTGTDQKLKQLSVTKMAVFWVVAPCSLVEVYQRFRGPYCLHHQGDRRPDDGGSKDL
jgi:hypothetical protein